MKVFFDREFYRVYTYDPAASAGRIESVARAIENIADFTEINPAAEEDILTCHTARHIQNVKSEGLFDIASIAAGGAIQAAALGLVEPCFSLIRPPGHHASSDSAWGFCYFNNMAIALTVLKEEGKIGTAFVLDFDLHFGDGTVNILGGKDWVRIYNPPEIDRNGYLRNVERILSSTKVDIIGISAGFDHHVEDWGGLLVTEDYFEMGRMVKESAKAANGGYFAILEGGYNHNVLGRNVEALMKGRA
ncbi:MAG: histone deacetylase family protein [Spirochaetes bacterium]|nr:histone deacetylase family protein [Spirochaetota bacterium]